VIWGMSLEQFTLLHVVLSLIGIVTGLFVLSGLLASNRLHKLTAAFLISTILTSVTGFFFPFTGFGPPYAVGVISLIALSLAVLGRYLFHLTGSWRWIYVVNAVLALYLNIVVGIVQAFQKLPFLEALAPTQSETPYFLVQGLVLLLFVGMGISAVKLFHPERRTHMFDSLQPRD